MRSRRIIAAILIYSAGIMVTTAQPRRPNVIFILADDMGYADPGIYGQRKIRTPQMDSLAREGLQFSNFYAGAPVCSPSRGSLITGLNTGHATIRGNNTLKGGVAGKKGTSTVYRANLSKDDYTIGNLMQDAGYRTYLVGKWHVGGYDSTATPLHRGFQRFSGWLINKPETYASTYWPAFRYKEGRIVEISLNSNNQKGYYETDMCTDEALAYLKESQGSQQPFFLMLNYNNPHSPLDAPMNPAYINTGWPEDMKTYASMVSNLDRSIGRIKQFLISSKLDKNTIVFICSDNGPRSEPSQQLTKVAEFFDSNGVLKGYKRDLYEGGIRIPMIVWSPGLIKAGRTSDLPSYFPDIMPTFASIARHQSPVRTDGLSIFNEIAGRKQNRRARFLYWEFFENGFEQALRYGKWKAIKREGKIELYDLEKDASEQNDIADRNPGIVALMDSHFKTERTDSPFWPVDIANRKKHERDAARLKSK